MPRRSDAEIGRLVRKALRGKRLRPRRLLDSRRPDGYIESDRDYLENNNDAAVALLEALTTAEHGLGS